MVDDDLVTRSKRPTLGTRAGAQIYFSLTAKGVKEADKASGRVPEST
jgi:hypothetical protein